MTSPTLLDLTEPYALYTILSLQPPNSSPPVVDNSPTSSSSSDASTASTNTFNSAYQSLLKKKYRRAAMKHHPDSGGLEENFRSIALAYEILNDEKKKDWYDLAQNGVFSASEYEEYLEMEKFQARFSEQAFQSMVKEKKFFENVILNKIVNIGWKLVQVVGLVGFFIGVLLFDVFWQSENRKIHWLISALSGVFAYWYWGRILSCWCLWCWCFAPWTLALLTPLVYSMRYPLWIALKGHFKSEIQEGWASAIIFVGVLELPLHFLYGYSWTYSLFYGALLYIFRHVLVLAVLSGSLLAHIMQIPGIYSGIFFFSFFILDVWKLHWLPIGYVSKLLILVWMLLFVLSSPGTAGEATSDTADKNQDEEDIIVTDSVTPTYAPSGMFGDQEDEKSNDVVLTPSAPSAPSDDVIVLGGAAAEGSDTHHDAIPLD